MRIFYPVFWAALVVLSGCELTKGSRPVSPTAPSGKSPGFVSVVFDDGRISAYQNAVPILDRAGLKSTHFIITGRFDSPGYIGRNEILSLQSRGHEIASHSRSHLDLTQMDSEVLRNEVRGSRIDLQNIGINNVSTFSYPFGAYNPKVVQAVRDAGYVGARSSDGGFNTSATDPFILVRQNLGGNVNLEQVKNWINRADEDGTWLILVLHHVDYSPNDYSITPVLFQEITNYLSSGKIAVVTVSAGITAVNR